MSGEKIFYKKMYESPCTLEDICLETVCDNILSYIEPLGTRDGWWESHRSSDSDSFDEEIKKFRFKDPEIFLIEEISEKLLKKFVEKRILCDSILNIFRIRNSTLSKIGLHILNQHKLVTLECVAIKKISIGDILDCLNPWSLSQIRNVNFTKCTFIDELRFTYMIKITNLKNLRNLNLAYTELNQTIFKIICEDLIHLETINISGTQVTDLRPLILLSSKLKSLSICDLFSAEHIASTLEQLQLLRYLDISFFNDKIEGQIYAHSGKPIVTLLGDSQILTELESLDVSGWREFITSYQLIKFIEAHPRLKYLGSVLCSANYDSIFSDTNKIDFPYNLVIAGLGNEEQIKVALKKYQDRSNYVQKALYHLFQLTSTFQEARPDVFNLVLPVMEAHSTVFGVQMAATACLYNLTRGELSKNIHPRTLSKGVHLTLYAMEYFPEEFQLQKNSLLTLCSDRILQDVHFDKFRCAKLVLDALCRFEDINMDRMAVAICSILAAKVSTEETSVLGARPEYMGKLLSMVKTRVDTKAADITLKFTLSALWNLTDESAATCKVFLEQKGAYLFLNVLQVFKENSAIETKVLGLLNNIAEVAALRESLMMDSLMDELYILLKSENIDVSYFAAGIVAHLASGGDKQWTLTSHTRDEMLEGLKDAVSQWKVPDSEMVAYRSFKPFFSLLRTDTDYQVQMWAVWAIHHVCTKNPKRYCRMLDDEKGHVILKDLILHKFSHPEIKKMCSLILETLDVNV
nr:protein zyg-11 homolog B-like [Leptinotarsa decemlineata]